MRHLPHHGRQSPVWRGVATYCIGGWLGGEILYVKGMGVEAVDKLAKKVEKQSSRKAA